MADEDFWGHSIKKGQSGEEKPKNDQDNFVGNLSTDAESTILKHDEKAIDISNEDLVNADQLEMDPGRIRSISRLPRKASTASVVGDKEKISPRTTVESENHHTRSPSYTSDEESGNESDRKTGSAEASDENRSHLGEESDENKRDAYSERFETSEAESEESESESEKESVDKAEAKKTTIVDRLKPFLIQETAATDKEAPATAKKVKRPKATKKLSPYTQKPLLSPRAPAIAKPPKRRPIANTTIVKLVPKTKSGPPAISNSKNPATSTSTVDPSRRLRSTSLRDEIEYLKKQLSESKTENRTLKQLQRRQEAALARLDTNRTSMPTLLERQAEEVRIAKEQSRMQKEKQRELERLLRERDDRLIHALDKIKRLDKALKDKGIEYRPQGANAEAAHVFKMQAEEKEKKILDLEKQNALLIKNHKHQLNIEVMRHKETQRKLRDFEEESKNRRNDKVRGYHTTRTARRSISENDRGAGQHLNVGQAPAASEMIKSVLSKRQESFDEENAPKQEPKSKNAKPKKNATDDGGSSKARQSRKSMKKKNSTVYEEDSIGDTDQAQNASGRRPSTDVVDETEDLNKASFGDTLPMEKTGSNPFQNVTRDNRPDSSTAVANSVNGSTTTATKTASQTPPSKLSDPLFLDNLERQNDSKSFSVLDEILQPTKTAPSPNKPASPPKTNGDFLDDLFAPRSTKIDSNVQKKVDSLEKDSKASSGADSGFDYSVDSTPKQVQSALQKTKSKTQTLDLDEDLFSPRKANGGPKAASNLFPWEADALKNAKPPQSTGAKPKDDLFSNAQIVL